jgi:hypothetical protein
MGAPLQRIQIIKGWLDGGEYRVEVFDYVAGDPTNAASVDLTTCEPQGSGAADLCTVWEDESFNPAQRAYYYARVIENPTCRWSTQQCVEANYDCENPTTELDDCCDPTTGLNVAFCDDVAAGLTGDQAACCRTVNPTSSTNVEFCGNVAQSLAPAEGQCCLPRLEPTIQERAWTSPIWYQP